LHAGACAHTVAIAAVAIKSCFATATSDFGFLLIIVFDFFRWKKQSFPFFTVALFAHIFYFGLPFPRIAATAV